MTPADGIRRLGFQRWYERELLSGHAHLVLALLSALAFLAALEGLSRFHGQTDQLIDLLALPVSGGVALWALRRYITRLMRAEHNATQAVCPQCGTYARFEPVSPQHADATREDGGNESAPLRVRCRRCHTPWTIHT